MKSIFENPALMLGAFIGAWTVALVCVFLGTGEPISAFVLTLTGAGMLFLLMQVVAYYGPRKLEWDKIHDKRTVAAAPIFGQVVLEEVDGLWTVYAEWSGRRMKLLEGGYYNEQDAREAAEAEIGLRLSRLRIVWLDFGTEIGAVVGGVGSFSLMKTDDGWMVHFTDRKQTPHWHAEGPLPSLSEAKRSAEHIARRYLRDGEFA